MKNPYIAGALNILPGLGYLYGRVKIKFALLLLSSCALSIADLLTNKQLRDLYTIMPITALGIVSCIVFASAFVYDGYRTVKTNVK